jgi:type II secretory pathway component PulF
MNLAGDNLMTIAAPAPTPVALPAGLRALAEELPCGKLSRRLVRLSARLEAGETWEAALKAPDVRLPEHIRGLIQAGLHSSRLATSLERLVNIQRRGQQIRQEIWLSLAYPLTLMTVLSLVFICFELFCIPPLGLLYEDFGVRLPLVTHVIISGSRPQAVGLMTLVAGILAAIVFIQASVRPIWLDVLFNRLPLLGALWQWSALIDFGRLLSLLLEAGVPLHHALMMTASGLRNTELKLGCRKLADGVRQGQSFSQAIQQIDPIPETVRPIIEWGEARSSLPEALDAAADMFEGRVLVQLDFVRTFLPPLAFLVVAGVILFSVLAVLLPLFQIMQSLM